MDHNKDDMANGIPPDEFRELKARIGFVSLRDGVPNCWVLLPRLLLERPCGEGAVPPNLLDESENADQSKRASIAHNYSKGGYGIDAYIIQLRMQVSSILPLLQFPDLCSFGMFQYVSLQHP